MGRSKRYQENEEYSGPCFEIGPNVQLKEVPTTGEEYLLKVKTERKNCAVVTCATDYSSLAKKQTLFAKLLPTIKSAPEKLNPTIEWKNIQVANFSEVCMYISRMRNKYPNKGVEVGNTSPDVWKKFLEKNMPTVSFMYGIKQSTLDRGLQYLVNTLDDIPPGKIFEQDTGRWIYAFLACSRQPLHSDTVSILRDLARKCADVRSRLDLNDENVMLKVNPLNLFICLVADYFGQKDLSDIPQVI